MHFVWCCYLNSTNKIYTKKTRSRIFANINISHIKLLTSWIHCPVNTLKYTHQTVYSRCATSPNLGFQVPCGGGHSRELIRVILYHVNRINFNSNESESVSEETVLSCPRVEVMSSGCAGPKNTMWARVQTQLLNCTKLTILWNRQSTLGKNHTRVYSVL